MDYYRVLLMADQPWEGDLDGRGQMSQRHYFFEFIEFMLDVCHDQVDCMTAAVDPSQLRERVPVPASTTSAFLQQGINPENAASIVALITQLKTWHANKAQVQQQIADLEKQLTTKKKATVSTDPVVVETRKQELKARQQKVSRLQLSLINIEYLAIIALAVALVAFFQHLLLRLTQPTLFFDAVGLGFFAAFGAHKTYAHVPNIELALLLGVITAVGGGIIRDVLLGRVPVVLTKEIYASAALLGAAIQLLGELQVIDHRFTPWAAIALCTLVRMLSLKYQWNLPAIKKSS